ncbi:MAG: metal ABC transporter ATP-binding protein [Amphritea sp.]|nr:metal ABC transporter ATP-binding protein [Amphritea sp.]
MSGPSISLEGVSLYLAGNCILDTLDTELAAGQLHILIGPNGAGKTSLLKTMLGLMPHSGRVSRHWPAKDTQRLPAYIPQQPQFDSVLPVTVADYLAAIISPRPLFFRQPAFVHHRVEQLLSDVGMRDKKDLKLGQLSGGERQRLMFAQALHRDASLWFMDEPMTGLDGEGQRIITDLIEQLRQQGKTLVMVHHDMNFVRCYADNVLLVDGGLKRCGLPAEVLGDQETAMLEVA